MITVRIVPETKMNMQESGNFSGSTYTTGERITCIVLYVMMMALIVVGNSILLFVVIKAKELKISSRIFLVSLTVADLIVGLVVIPVRVVPQIIGLSLGTAWFASDWLCEASYFLEVFAISASVLAVLALTIERYLAVEMPLRFRSLLTSFRASVVVAFSWIISLCTASTLMIVFLKVYRGQFMNFDGDLYLCTTNRMNWVAKFLFLSFTTVYFLIPICVTFLAAIRILHIVKKHTAFQKQAPNLPDCNCACRQTAAAGASGATQLPRRYVCDGVCRGLCKCFMRNKKALVTVLVLTLSYSVSSVPFVVYVFYTTFSPYIANQFLVELAKLSLITSYFINVVVYTIRNRAFRGSAKRLICRMFRVRCNSVERRPVTSLSGDLKADGLTQDTYV